MGFWMAGRLGHPFAQGKIFTPSLEAAAPSPAAAVKKQ